MNGADEITILRARLAYALERAQQRERDVEALREMLHRARLEIVKLVEVVKQLRAP